MMGRSQPTCKQDNDHRGLVPCRQKSPPVRAAAHVISIQANGIGRNLRASADTTKAANTMKAIYKILWIRCFGPPGTALTISTPLPLTFPNRKLPQISDICIAYYKRKLRGEKPAQG